MNIGETIRNYRLQKGMSQGDIEKRTGLLRCYLSRVENGHTIPSLDTLAKIASQNVFSTTGKPPGNNHEKSGGNVLFCDGHAEFTAPRAAFALPLGEGAVLLNPKP